jgi:hypothetical protein
MLELLISILLSFGLSTTPVDGKLAVSPEVAAAAKSSPEYTDKGGDAALYTVVVADDVDPVAAH